MYGSVRICFCACMWVSVGIFVYVCGLLWEHSHQYMHCSGHNHVYMGYSGHNHICTWVAVVRTM
jgi:hypothetical protein